ncbi:CxC2 domain-containing protein [Mycena venus]|uniref:CxC2 domain-containing protein n=1 Tax=Mycena venus TaxID=2733690 RepID=A0A8H6X6J2_9AGAR|nr:CxC2 domain-containing protein [Mycena venus]
MAVSGVVGCACDHAVVGSFIDMLKGEAFALGTYAQREQLKHTNSPPHGPGSTTPTIFSYDSYCSFVVNMVKRAIDLFPEETWLHVVLAAAEGQIPADHINGHGTECQAVYFACRSHFHGGDGDAWNTWKVLRQAELLAAERLDALRLFELHMAVVEDLSWQHATKWMARFKVSISTSQLLTIDNALASMLTEERSRLTREDEQQPRMLVAEWIHDGISLECQEVLIITLLESHREHPMQETWATITKLRNTLNLDLKKFRECQLTIYPCLRLSVLNVDEPELTAVLLPSYRMKHGQRLAMDAEDSKLRDAEIKLWCGQANSNILAVRTASLVLSAVKKARDLNYRGQAGITHSQQNVQKVELMKAFEITMYNRAQAMLIHLGHMVKDAVEPYPPLSHRDTQRKETHLHRAKGDSRLFDGTAWYLQTGVTISRAVVASAVSPVNGSHDSDNDEPQLLAGMQTLKWSGFTKSQRTPKHLKDIAPDDVVVESASVSEAEDSDLEMSPSAKRGKQAQQGKKGKKTKKSDGWTWLESMMRGQTLGKAKLAAYKEESDRVQWFCAEAEMYRWLEQYERKHAEMMRVIERSAMGGRNGVVNFAHMQAAMYKRLQHNTTVIFKSAESGTHRDWVLAMTFDELVMKIDGWRNVVFKWMDEMEIHRAYKDF